MTLDQGDIDAIAERVAELLRPDAPAFPTRGLVDVDQVAQLLSVEREWVYDHKTELGAVRIGNGRGRLRFEAPKVLAYVAERRLKTEVAKPAARKLGRPRRSRRAPVELLPIPDKVA